VGDPQQLPPTSFFERIDLPDEDETQAEDYVDTESILDLALAVFHSARELRWHYRRHLHALTGSPWPGLQSNHSRSVTMT
jgi:superfamily I DNA and/or RNA helicase